MRKKMLSSRCVVGIMVVCFMFLIQSDFLYGADKEDVSEIINFFNTYYDRPQPNKAVSVLQKLLEEDKQPLLSAGAIHFFATIFQKNPALLKEVKAIKQKHPQPAQELLDKVIEETEQYVSQLDARAVRNIDKLWGEYNATGNQAIVQEVIKALVPGENDNNMTYADMAAARWSLIHMARRHKKVYALCESYKVKAGEDTKAILDDILKNATNQKSKAK